MKTRQQIEEEYRVKQSQLTKERAKEIRKTRRKGQPSESPSMMNTGQSVVC